MFRERHSNVNVQMVEFKEIKWLGFWTIGEVQVLGGPGQPVCIVIIIISSSSSSSSSISIDIQS